MSENLYLIRHQVGPRDKTVYESLQNILSADKSYALYRVELQKALVSPPGIPYMWVPSRIFLTSHSGVYLRDCTYFGDGLYDDGIVNIKKVLGIWGVVQQVCSCLQH